jgi:hypothetical protein
MIAATAPNSMSAVSHAGRPELFAAVGMTTAMVASSGKIARIGMTEMSWNSSTEKLACPPCVLSKLRSASVDSTIAVDDAENVQPTATAIFQFTPTAIATPATASAVNTTCAPPSMKIGLRSCHSSDGRSSSPTTNSIITTPNSAKCPTPACSRPTKSNANGPISTPATR